MGRTKRGRDFSASASVISSVCVSSSSRFRPLCSPQIGDRSANQKSRKLLKFQDGPRPRINEPEKSHWCARPNLTFSTWTRRFMNFPGYAFSRRPLKARVIWQHHAPKNTHTVQSRWLLSPFPPPSWPVPPWSLAARASPPARPSRPAAKPAVSIGARNMMSLSC